MPTVVFKFRKRPNLSAIVDGFDDYAYKLLGNGASKVIEGTTTSPLVRYRGGPYECVYILVQKPDRKHVETKLFVRRDFPDIWIDFSVEYKDGKEVMKVRDEDDVVGVIYSMFGNVIGTINRLEESLARLPKSGGYWAWIYLEDSGVTVRIPVAGCLWLQIKSEYAKARVTYSLESSDGIDLFLPFINQLCQQEVKNSG